MSSKICPCLLEPIGDSANNIIICSHRGHFDLVMADLVGQLRIFRIR